MHHLRTFIHLFAAPPVAALSLGLALSCGGSTPPPAEPAPPAAETTEAPAEPPAAEVAVPDKWHAGLTKEEKGAFMKAKVVPAMDKVFKEYDAQGYAQFGCVTCHGPEYKMPVDYLPRLTLAGGKLTAFEEDPDTSKFMAEKVTPAMVAVLGVEPYNPETHQGFGCGGCHAIDMK